MYAAKRFSYSPPVYRGRAALVYNEHLNRGFVVNEDGSFRYDHYLNEFHKIRWRSKHLFLLYHRQMIVQFVRSDQRSPLQTILGCKAKLMRILVWIPEKMFSRDSLINQRTNGPVNAHQRSEIKTNKFVGL